jgi:hypothetical protein
MKNFCITGLLLFVSALCFGQAPKSAFYSSSSDVFVGYMATFPDYGTSFYSLRFNGAEVAYSKVLTRRWSVIASGDGVFGSYFDVRQYSGTVGPKFNFLIGNIRPYATVQAGFAYQNSDHMYAFDHHPHLNEKYRDIEDGFSYRAGLGGDVQLSRHVYWRAIQWDVQPQPWARHIPVYENFSSGIGYSFQGKY